MHWSNPLQSARRLNAGLSERLCLEEMEMEAEAVLSRVKARGEGAGEPTRIQPAPEITRATQHQCGARCSSAGSRVYTEHVLTLRCWLSSLALS